MTPRPQARWWSDGVGYEIYIRSWQDADGDGVGDLKGLAGRLDHLAWLGVDIVWITPFYASPMHDHGYDVADYTAVHPQFGTLADIDAVVARAHELGMRVVIDLVPNHSSSEHEWFRAARSAKDSPYRDYYIWRDGRVPGPPEAGGEPPNNWVSVFGGRAWSYDPDSGQWWLHLFLPEQPDLNWANPAVRDEFDAILRFWLERGVDGFRIDVAHALAKHPDLPDIPLAERPVDPHDIGDAVSQSDWERFEHPYDVDQEEVTEIYRRWRAVAEPFDAVLLGEVYLQDPAKLSRYLNSQDGLHLSFWFKPLHVRWSPEAIREVIRSAVREIPDHLAWVQGSHDRTRAATRFGGGDLGRARSLALGTLYMGLPGVPFLYMGEELGLEDVPVPPERSQDPIAVRHNAPERARDNCRTPMPWEPAPGLGFTTAADAWLPFGDRAPADTVAVQREDAASWLHRWRRLIQARKTCDLGEPAIQWEHEDGDVVAYRRGTTVVAANCGEVAGALDLPRGEWEIVFDSLAGGRDGERVSAQENGALPLAPLQAVILRRARMPDDLIAQAGTRLLPERAVATLEDYVDMGGGTGLRRALSMDPADVREQVRSSGLRGRGGAGFPTGVKWNSVVEAAQDGDTVYLVCNAAEGEPGTYKDRVLMRRNPYQLLEGVLIALHAIGAAEAYVPTKERFTAVRERLEEALEAMRATRWEGADRIRLVAGPDAYLFGEESAMLEVIEGRLPMPRILPPYQQGLFADISHGNPTVVNNVETLSHVTHILARGPEWFREVGTVETPGTMVFSVMGDIESPGVYELPMGTPLRVLICDIAGARDVKAIYSGVSNTVITPDLLDLPMDFDSFREAGSGLGSGGFVVYDSSRDIVQILSELERFLAVESCGQCNACKLGNMDMAERLDKLVRGEGTAADIDQLHRRLATVTDQNRCFLPVGAQLTVGSTLEAFAEEFRAHIGVAADPAVALPVPKIIRLHPDTGDVTLDDEYWRKRPDWSDDTPGPEQAWPGPGAVIARGPDMAP